MDVKTFLKLNKLKSMNDLIGRKAKALVTYDTLCEGDIFEIGSYDETDGVIVIESTNGVGMYLCSNDSSIKIEAELIKIHVTLKTLLGEK